MAVEFAKMLTFAATRRPKCSERRLRQNSLQNFWRCLSEFSVPFLPNTQGPNRTWPARR
jgi:hypothetical protein